MMADQPGDSAEEAWEEGGDPACWAGLVCPECGSVTSEGHRDGCPLAGDAADEGEARRGGRRPPR